jgi:hypothetical protein
MAIQYSVAVNNARLDSIETTVGTSPKLRIYTGAQPANCGTAASGTMLVEMALPSDWLGAASAAQKSKAGTWSGVAAAGGTAAHYRIYDSAGTTCHEQGSVGLGSGDLSLDNTNIANGQTVTVTAYQKNAANT